MPQGLAHVEESLVLGVSADAEIVYVSANRPDDLVGGGVQDDPDAGLDHDAPAACLVDLLVDILPENPKCIRDAVDRRENA